MKKECLKSFCFSLSLRVVVCPPIGGSQALGFDFAFDFVILSGNEGSILCFFLLLFLCLRVFEPLSQAFGFAFSFAFSHSGKLLKQSGIVTFQVQNVKKCLHKLEFQRFAKGCIEKIAIHYRCKGECQV
ncbi:MAG: hypothetical protein K8I03_11225 [Ignavibacteria bacterium]|nr:hypothetical protein [Ignavibacteria bacterium]